MSTAQRSDVLERVELRLANVAVAAAVLPRVVGVLAARAGLTLDRLNDATLVADLIAASVDHGGQRLLALRLDRHEAELVLVVRELGPGDAERLIAGATIDGIGSVLERLADEVRVEQDGAEVSILVGRR